MQKLLFETYRSKLHSNASTSSKAIPRKRYVWVSSEDLPSGVTLTDGGRTLVVSNENRWRTVRFMPAIDGANNAFCEIKVNQTGGNMYFGITCQSSIQQQSNYVGAWANSFSFQNSGNFYPGGTYNANCNFVAGDRIGLALDPSFKKLSFFKNGNVVATKDVSFTVSELFFVMSVHNGGDSATLQPRKPSPVAPSDPNSKRRKY